ncbi:MAG: WecB/TagA/CpsF family glycosyltransferase [Firmicutes bacterium]|nr:WecB/TagA/CpsF family glycosyltransferase [Bacillota bacterium]
MGRTQVLGIGFDPVTMSGALAKLESYVNIGKPHLVITANPEMVMRARGDQLLAEIMDRADLVVADGIGVVWASSVISQKVPERIPGIELAEGLLEKAAQAGWKVFLLGGAEGVSDRAAKSLKERLPSLQIVGTHHGFFKPGLEEEAVIASIKQAKPDILLAALGVPRQEKWLAAHLGVLKVPVAIGVGGSFNVWAGVDKRAPRWVRNIHLEWLYRLVRQPWRIKRMTLLPIFAFTVLGARLRQGR